MKLKVGVKADLDSFKQQLQLKSKFFFKLYMIPLKHLRN